MSSRRGAARLRRRRLLGPGHHAAAGAAGASATSTPTASASTIPRSSTRIARARDPAGLEGRVDLPVPERPHPGHRASTQRGRKQYLYHHALARAPRPARSSTTWSSSPARCRRCARTSTPTSAARRAVARARAGLRHPAAGPRLLPHRHRGLRRRRTRPTGWPRCARATSRVDGDALPFDYPAKSGKRRVQAVVDPDVAEVVAALKRRRGGGDELLAYKRNRRWVDVRSRRHQRVPQGGHGPRHLRQGLPHVGRHRPGRGRARRLAAPTARRQTARKRAMIARGQGGRPLPRQHAGRRARVLHRPARLRPLPAGPHDRPRARRDRRRRGRDGDPGPRGGGGAGPARGRALLGASRARGLGRPEHVRVPSYEGCLHMSVLATLPVVQFVIGLREGVEAALDRRDRGAFLHQRAAATRCAGCGPASRSRSGSASASPSALQIVDQQLPQRQQEQLETIVGARSRSAMVTFMIVWMRRHARELRGELRASAGARARGGLGVGARRDGVLRGHARGARDRGLPARRVPGARRPAGRRHSARCSACSSPPRSAGGSTAAACGSTCRASSASPPSLLVLVAAGLRRQRAAHRARGGLAQRPAGPGARPLVARPPGTSTRLAAHRRARPPAAADVGEVLGWLLYAIPMLAVRAVARSAGAVPRRASGDR